MKQEMAVSDAADRLVLCLCCRKVAHPIYFLFISNQ